MLSKMFKKSVKNEVDIWEMFLSEMGKMKMEEKYRKQYNETMDRQSVAIQALVKVKNEI